MLRVMIVEDEDMIRKGLVFTIDWLSMDCVVVAEASMDRKAMNVSWNTSRMWCLLISVCLLWMALK